MRFFILFIILHCLSVHGQSTDELTQNSSEKQVEKVTDEEAEIGDNEKVLITKRNVTADTGNWTVGDCLIAEFAMSIVLYANTTQKQNGTDDIIHLDVPPHASVDSDGHNNCLNDTQRLVLSWVERPFNVSQESSSSTSQLLSRNLTFNFGHDNDTYGIQRVFGSFEVAHFNSFDTKLNKTVEITSLITIDTLDLKPRLLFRTPLGFSFLCGDVGDWSIKAHLHYSFANAPPSGTPLANATIDANDVQLDAFRDGKAPTNVFQTPQDCDLMPNDVVPAIVGITLALLIVVVLGAYVYGRRRSQSLAYQNV